MLEVNNLVTPSPEQWEDTMLLSAYAGYEGGLKVTAELLDLPAEAELDRAISIMCEETEWSKGLPLNAAGFTSKFYMKD